MSQAPSATARAQPNIALVKYWGKRDAALNLPAVGSLSVTLGNLYTETTVTLDESLDADVLELDGLDLDGGESSAEQTRVREFLTRLRERCGVASVPRARVRSHNNFPTAAGLASSASGFAALTVAAAGAYGVTLSATDASVLARIGSGSAPRSLYGGFVEMRHGERDDGEDAIAVQVAEREHWPLHVLVAQTAHGRKKIGSTAGMQRTADSSPFYPAWVEGAEADLASARDAIARRDFEALAAVTEQSCLKMHAVAAAARPGVIYWNGTTVEVMHALRALREAEGVALTFTIDAGPHVKVFTPSAESAAAARVALERVEGVVGVLDAGMGPGAQLVDVAGGAGSS
ncbi:MAG: diphosphomevalonate decarboxylase [Myxococcales bacterium]|nr:diphosphomevalonate decarboxylase [Myxococcales bacterium]